MDILLSGPSRINHVSERMCFFDLDKLVLEKAEYIGVREVLVIEGQPGEKTVEYSGVEDHHEMVLRPAGDEEQNRKLGVA